MTDTTTNAKNDGTNWGRWGADDERGTRPGHHEHERHCQEDDDDAPLPVGGGADDPGRVGGNDAAR